MKPVLDLTRPVSWSNISSFAFDAEQWRQKYVVHGKCRGPKDGEPAYCEIMEGYYRSCPVIATSPQLEFGKKVGERLATDPKYMKHVPRYEAFEYEFGASIGDIPLIGFADGFTKAPDSKALHVLGEYKTGKSPWTQKRADEHGQITMYLLMLYLKEKIRPEDVTCFLHWMPTTITPKLQVDFLDKKKVTTFETRRTMTDIIEFAAQVKEVRKQMIRYAAKHG